MPGIAQAPVTPTFREFAAEWLDARSRELRETALADYSWQLTSHLLPFFHGHHLPRITVAEVDRYREARGPRGPAVRRVDQQDDHQRQLRRVSITVEGRRLAAEPVVVDHVVPIGGIGQLVNTVVAEPQGYLVPESEPETAWVP